MKKLIALAAVLLPLSAMAEIKPLELKDGPDLEQRIAALSPEDRVRYGKYIGQVVCGECHNEDFEDEGKAFFISDMYMEERILKQKKRRFYLRMKSKLKRNKMPPDGPYLPKYQWEPILDYVKAMEKEARK